MITRAAIVLAVLLLGSAAAVALIPASYQQETCGTWVSPEWERGEVKELLDDAENLADASEPFGGSDGQAAALSLRVAEVYTACESALDSRLGWTIGLGAAGVVLPFALLFVAWGRNS